MTTQAWGFRALMGCGRKAPSPPKGGKVGCDAGKSPPFMALDFLVVTKGSEACPPLSASLV